MKMLFLDTNIFMHCHPPDQINWLGVFEVPRVGIIVPMVVIDELDRHKDQHPDIKLRHRARERLKQLEGWAAEPEVEICKNVCLKVEDCAPSIEFEAHRLLRDKPDHLLIASMLQHREDHPEADIMLVAHDVGPRIKASRLGFEVAELSEEWRLKSELDPLEKENRELRQKVQRIENALPKLCLAFATKGGSQPWVEVIVREVVVPTARTLKKQVRELEEKYPRMLTSREKQALAVERSDSALPEFLRANLALQESLQASLLERMNEVADEDIEAYNRRLQVYYSKYWQYLSDIHEYRATQGVTAALDIIMLNDGTKPGEDISVSMHFPDGFSLYGEGDLPGEPEPPKPPAEPLTQHEKMMRLITPAVPNIDDLIIRGYPNLNFGPSNVGGLDIKKTNSHDVELHVGRIKHGVPEKLPRLYLVFDSFEAASSFTVDYMLKAANLPQPTTGKLHVKVEKEPIRGK